MKLSPLNKILVISLFLLFSHVLLLAQSDSVKFNVSVSALGAAGKYAPFWLQNNRYDLITPTTAGINLMGEIRKEYNNNKDWDYCFKFSELFRLDKNKTTIIPHEFYIKGRYKSVELCVGAREEIIGNQDSNLSVGGFIF